MVDIVSYQAKKALSDDAHAGYPELRPTVADELISGEPLLGQLREEDFSLGKDVILRKRSR